MEQSCSTFTHGNQIVDYREYIMLSCEWGLLNLGYKFKKTESGLEPKHEE